MKKKHQAMMLFGILAITSILSAISCAHTRPVHDENGNRLDLVYDTRERISLNGTEQMIYLAGTSRENPILLWLDGGPGGAEVGWVRKYLGSLHEQFTIICWDQRGTAGSYAAGNAGLTVDLFVEDTVALSRYLIDRFNKEKIFLVGHSWGTVIGALAAEAHPELYHAYVAGAQHVNSTENDTIGYHMILEGAQASGDHKTVQTLKKIGLPPYNDGQSYYEVLSRLYKYSPSAPADKHFSSMSMFFAPEHTLLAKINLVRGVIRGVKEVYPQLAHRDLEQEILEFNCPLFLVNGRYDFSCVASISERWFNKVEAPYKELLWLEESGHNGIYTEPEKFIGFMIDKVRPLATD